MRQWPALPGPDQKAPPHEQAIRRKAGNYVTSSDSESQMILHQAGRGAKSRWARWLALVCEGGAVSYRVYVQDSIDLRPEASISSVSSQVMEKFPVRWYFLRVAQGRTLYNSISPWKRCWIAWRMMLGEIQAIGLCRRTKLAKQDGSERKVNVDDLIGHQNCMIYAT